MRAKTPVWMVAIVITVMLIACAAPTPAVVEKPVQQTAVVQQTAAPTPEPKITLTYWFWPVNYSTGGTGQPDEWPKASIAQFQKLHPNVTVNLEMMEMSDKGTQKLDVAAASNNLPDVAYMDLSYLTKYVDIGVVEPIDGYLTPDDVADFAPAMLDYVTVEGKHYAWPFMEEHWIWYVNRTAADKHGVLDLLPKDSDMNEYGPRAWTMDQFVKVAKALSYTEGGKKTYAWDIQAGPGRWSFMMWAWNFGAHEFSKDCLQCLYNSPQAIQALQFTKDMVDQGIFHVSPTTEGAPNVFKGELNIFPFVPMPTDQLKTYLTKNAPEGYPPLDLYYVQPPLEPGYPPYGYAGSGGFMVFKPAKADPYRTKMAMEFANWLTKGDNGKVVVNVGAFPARKSNGDLYGNDPIMKFAASFRPWSDDLGHCPGTNDIYQIVGPELVQPVLVGHEDPTTVANRFVVKANDILKKTRLQYQTK